MMGRECNVQGPASDVLARRRGGQVSSWRPGAILPFWSPSSEEKERSCATKKVFLDHG